MFLARTMTFERSEMSGSAVSGMLCKSIGIKSTIQLVHVAISCHFRDDRCGRDAEAKRVSVNEPGLRGGVFHQKGVTQQAIGFQLEIVDGAFEGDAIGWAKTEQINFFSVDDSYGHRESRFTNNAECNRSLDGAQRFGIADKRPELADAIWIQDHGGGNERTGERSPSRFVNSGDARITASEKCGFVLICWGRNCHVRPASKNENGA